MRLYEASHRNLQRAKWYGLLLPLALLLVMLCLAQEERRSIEVIVPAAGAEPTPTPTPRPIKQISILGERNSGTRWTFAHLGECFNHTLKVRRGLTRYKHWFQYQNYTKYPHDTLVINQFRNPYDWLEAMRNVPHHSPEHVFLHWSEFLTKPWTMERYGRDIGLANDTMCQDDFRYNQIVSCIKKPLTKEEIGHKTYYSGIAPFYELKQDGSGEPFANIMEMRAAKIRNFLEVKDYEGVADAWTVQYEYLLSMGTKKMLDMIAEKTGVPYKCDPIGPQNRRKRQLSSLYAQFVNNNLDWDAEALIGYKMKPPEASEFQ